MKLNLEHLKISDEGQFNEHLSVIVSNPHYGEYKITETPGSSVTQIYDWSDTDDIIQILFPGIKSTDEKLVLVSQAVIKDYTNEYNNSNLADIGNEEEIANSHLIRITFWKHGRSSLTEVIDDFISSYRNDAVFNIENASGDDSFYDYAPSYYDVYRQLCELFRNRYIEEYNQTTKSLIEESEDGELSEAIHVFEIIAVQLPEDESPE